MKKTWILGIACSLLLTGCAVGTPDSPAAETQTEEADTALNTALLRAEYYQKLSAELQRELQDMKSDFAESRTEYESRIDALEEAIRQNVPPEETQEFLFEVREGKATLLSYRGKDKEVQIPAAYGNCPVTAIADRAFENNTKITSVRIPDGIAEIGWFAFSGCVSLTSVELPASVAVIRYGAFQNCSRSITFYCPDGSFAGQYANSYGIPIGKSGT